MPKRLLDELINTTDSALPLIQAWIKNAHNHVGVLPTGRRRGEEVLLHLQVTTRSPVGAMALETGGMFIDHGWLRFLGSGCERMNGNLQNWNADEGRAGHYPLKDALIIAHDVLGGFFALNGGAFSGKLGTVFYFAPDTLQWEDTHKSYSGLLEWAICGDVGLFYETMRWPNWEQETASLNGDQKLSIPSCFSRKVFLLQNVQGVLFR